MSCGRRCAICKQGEIRPGEALVPLVRDGAIVFVKDAPAKIRDNCDESYPDEAMTERVASMAERAAARGVEIEVRRFAARAGGGQVAANPSQQRSNIEWSDRYP